MENNHIRAYLNPQPAFSEAEQRAIVAPFNPAETYVESRGESRDSFIGSLRSGDEALVPELFVLAKADGRKDTRVADLFVAWDEILAIGAVIVEGSTKHRSDDKAQRREMRTRAQEALGRAAKAGKVGKKPFGYLPEELRTMQAIMESRNYKNWPERRDAIMLAGIVPPGRSWALTVLPRLVAALSADVKPARLPRKRPSRVYFIQDGARVKIGHSMDPRGVLKALARGNYRELTILGTLPGGRERESALHKKFDRFRIKNGSSAREWFILAPPIKAYISRYCKPTDRGKNARKAKR